MSKTIGGNNPDSDTLIPLFQSIGLSPSKAGEAAKNQKGASVLKDLVERHGLAVAATSTGELGGLGGRIRDEKQAGLIAGLASQIAKSGGKLDVRAQDYVLEKILVGDLKSVDQVNSEFFFFFFCWAWSLS